MSVFLAVLLSFCLAKPMHLLPPYTAPVPYTALVPLTAPALYTAGQGFLSESLGQLAQLLPPFIAPATLYSSYPPLQPSQPKFILETLLCLVHSHSQKLPESPFYALPCQFNCQIIFQSLLQRMSGIEASLSPFYLNILCALCESDLG